MLRLVALAILSASTTLVCVTPLVCAQTDPGLARLQSDLERIAQSAGGVTGVAVRHIESGREAHLHRGQRFPMGSTFKLPVAVQLLTLVDEGKLSLDKVITLRPGDLRPGSGTLVKSYDPAKPDYSLRSLLELMMIISDNSATDVLWKEAGARPRGPRWRKTRATPPRPKRWWTSC